MSLDFRPEFHIDFKLEVVWPKLKGAFAGIAAAFRGLVLPDPARRGRLSPRKKARLLGWVLAALFAAAALAAVLLLIRS